MYDNIGGKIKSWAVWIFIVEAIAAIIGGIALSVRSLTKNVYRTAICRLAAATVTMY